MFWIYYLGGGSFKDFHLTLPIMMALIPETKDIMWRLLQLPSVSAGIMHTETMSSWHIVAMVSFLSEL